MATCTFTDTIECAKRLFKFGARTAAISRITNIYPSQLRMHCADIRAVTGRSGRKMIGFTSLLRSQDALRHAAALLFLYAALLENPDFKAFGKAMCVIESYSVYLECLSEPLVSINQYLDLIDLVDGDTDRLTALLAGETVADHIHAVELFKCTTCGRVFLHESHRQPFECDACRHVKKYPENPS